MAPAMLGKAREAQEMVGCNQLQFEHVVMEDLPVPDNWADVIISNGVFILAPDKTRVLWEMHRVLTQGGRLQIADIIVQKQVPESAKRNIDLWTG